MDLRRAKAIARLLTPPIILKIKNRFLKKLEDPNFLFDGNDEMFKRLVNGVSKYAEYGCGKSTIWANTNSICMITTVDTSNSWLEHVREQCTDEHRLECIHVDLGELKDWGTPKNYDYDSKFKDYTDALWDNEKPELVLIDGRFRVCCFLTTLLKGSEGTKIIFDDYVNRPHYHIVERFIKPTEYCGRQALFVIPNKKDLDLAEIEKLTEKFRYVMA